MAIKLEPHAEPLPGYKLIDRLGGGGFGEVWKAEAPGGFFKAIKFVYGLVDATDEEGARAEQELKALERIKVVRHPFILTLERWEIVDGQLIIVMELADRTLWDRFKECRSQGQPGIPRAELLEYLRETAEALDFMYSQFHLQHLDIKPQNLFLVYNHVKVADFGLIKDIKGTYASITGGVTPVYAAPETFDGKVRKTTDQYSLAIVYQELLTGRRPFSGTTARQLVLQHLQAQPDLSVLPIADRAAVGKALNKDFSQRYDSCKEFVEALLAATPKSRKTLADEDSDFDEDWDVGEQVNSPPGSSLDAMPTRGRPDRFGEQKTKPPGSYTSPDISIPSSHLTARSEMPVHDPSSQTPPVSSRLGADVFTPMGSALPPRSAPFTTQQQLSNYKKTAPPLSEDGSLKPALVIGLGQSGQEVLRQFRTLIGERFSAVDRVPHIRFLYMDTDGEDLAKATKGSNFALYHNETFHAKLQRAGYYMKWNDCRELLEPWLDLRILYRIPRQQVPVGVRALGRVAFVDNYPNIVRRLESELMACFDPDPLKVAMQRTGEKVYSTRPRIFIVTSLAGGTGSGMFIDMAYAIHHLYRKMGLENPDIVGVFLLPHGNQPQNLTGLVNGYAALTELQHFADPAVTFKAKHKSLDPAQKSDIIKEKTPPFRRCLLIPTDSDKYQARFTPTSENGETPPPASVVQAGNFLFSDLCTVLGRSADKYRQQWADIYTPWRENKTENMLFQTVGMFRIVWPRQHLIRRVASGLCKTLVEQWMTKDSKPLRETVQLALEKKWQDMHISPDEMIMSLKGACEKHLGKAPEVMFQELIDPIAEVVVPATNPGPGKNARPFAGLPIGKAIEALEKMEHLIGLPDGCQPVGGVKITGPPEMGTVTELLKKAAAKFGHRCETKIAQMVVRQIEQPDYRLAGAEETLRQFSRAVEQALQNQEELAKELHERSAKMHTRLLAMLENPNRSQPQESSGWKLTFSKRNKTPDDSYAREVLELLRIYPKCRFQALILQYTSSFYVALRGLLSDQLREVDFCRQRLKELHEKFQELFSPSAVADSKTKRPLPEHLGKLLLPEGCRTFEEASHQLARQISPEDLKALDTQIQAMIKKQFRALVQVCMTANSVTRNLVPAMQAEAEAFLAPRLENADVVQMFLHENATRKNDDLYLEEEAEVHEILTAFDEAAPGLVVAGCQEELRIVAIPSTPSAEELKALTQQAFKDKELHFAHSKEEIIFYREQLHTSLDSLRYLTRQAQEGYQKLLEQEASTPHSRTDITDWRKLIGKKRVMLAGLISSSQQEFLGIHHCPE
jgi:eukaryotic-like serine/threonine-protein kinase